MKGKDTEGRDMKNFTKVRCRAYLKKVHDTVRIQLYDRDGMFTDKYVKDYESKAIAYKFNPETGQEEEIADLSSFDGDSVEKTYRERVEETFEGFLVGFTRIKVKGRIGTDWETPLYGPEYGYCFKSIDEYPKVGVVYFKNNAKRYVLPEDMEEKI